MRAIFTLFNTLQTQDAFVSFGQIGSLYLPLSHTAPQARLVSDMPARNDDEQHRLGRCSGASLRNHRLRCIVAPLTPLRSVKGL